MRIASVLLLVLSGTGIGIRAGKCGGISTGVFCFPNDKAAQIAVQTVQEYLEETPDSSVKNVIFNVFKNEDLQIYERILRS